jgi:8-amino-7-oxononanoate synthase
MKDYLMLELSKLKSQDQLRSLREVSGKKDQWITLEQKKYFNLSSNDYLGIAGDKSLLDEFFAKINSDNQIDHYALSNASSRLLTGNSRVYAELENKLATLYHKESALVLNSGYHANTGIIPALMGKDDLILCDKYNHASIIDGIRLSGAKFIRYPHLDYEHLGNILRKERNNYRNAAIISESIFSMDGDQANIHTLVALKKEFHCLLILDEAHGAGVFGAHGLGLAQEQDCLADIDILIGTFGKAYGSLGAYCVMDSIYREYLVNKMRTLIFSTALAPINLSWSLFILEQNQRFASRRNKLLDLARKLRTSLLDKGLEVLGESQIIPIVYGQNKLALQASEKLKQNGYLAFAIRPPTVPVNTARLRLSLTSALDLEDLSQILEIL